MTLVPEPTSIENGYRFLKAAFYRRLKAVEKLYGIQELLQAAGHQTGATQGPRALLAEVSKRDATVGRLLELEMQRFQAAAGHQHGPDAGGLRGRRRGRGGLAQVLRAGNGLPGMHRL